MEFRTRGTRNALLPKHVSVPLPGGIFKGRKWQLKQSEQQFLARV